MKDVKEISRIIMPGFSDSPSPSNSQNLTFNITDKEIITPECTQEIPDSIIEDFERLIEANQVLSYKTQTNEVILADIPESFFTFKTNTKDTESINIYLDPIESKYKYFLKDNATLQVVFDFFEEKLNPYLDKCNKTENP